MLIGMIQGGRKQNQNELETRPLSSHLPPTAPLLQPRWTSCPSLSRDHSLSLPPCGVLCVPFCVNTCPCSSGNHPSSPAQGSPLREGVSGPLTRPQPSLRQLLSPSARRFPQASTHPLLCLATPSRDTGPRSWAGEVWSFVSMFPSHRWRPFVKSIWAECINF